MTILSTGTRKESGNEHIQAESDLRSPPSHSGLGSSQPKLLSISH